MFVATDPYCGLPAASPPRTMTRPSARIVCPAQKRLLAAGSGVIAPVLVSSTFAPAPSSKNSTDDVPGTSTACCITVPPEGTGLLHDPTVARGSTGWVVVVVVVVVVLVEVVVVAAVVVVAPVVEEGGGGGGAVVAVVFADVTGTHAAATNPTAAPTRYSARRLRPIPCPLCRRRPRSVPESHPSPATAARYGAAIARVQRGEWS